MIAWQGLHYRFANGVALTFPDFQVPERAGALLMGPSGSGKSTLLALLARLLTPTQGRISLGDPAPVGPLTSQDNVGPPQVIWRPSGGPGRASPGPWRGSGCVEDDWRGATIGFVPQRLHLVDSLSVADNLALPWLAAGLPVDRPRIAALMGQLGLQGLAERRPGELSVGQAQRVAVARAVSRCPVVVLADEPTAHLDDQSTRSVLHLLQEACQSVGASLLVATHDARVGHWWSQAPIVQLGHP